jgi:hypothetical protein
MIIAITAVHTVPKIRTAIPQLGGSASGAHTSVAHMLVVFVVIAGIDLSTRNTAIAPMITSTHIPDAVTSHRKLRSAGRTEAPAI